MDQTFSVATTFVPPQEVKTGTPEKMHRIRTPRLYMRPVDYADLDDYIELLTDPEVMKFIGLKTGQVLEHHEIMALLDGAVEAWSERGWGRWSVFNNQDEFVGFCGFRKEEDQPELLALSHQRFWGSDINTEAAFACIDYARRNFGFGEIKAFTHPENFGSRRLLEKLSAIYEGDVEFHGIVASKYTLLPAMAASA